ncbi:MAG TPA: TetR/AcrR family transcriptional regulator [Elusimicrobiota bacterium]|nr:TetR/AcrR family transcriptional regulator [Elusimicrobiota bacterium]
MANEPGTRRVLLETALNVIWENSYGSTSVDDICRRAGVQKGSFYHFFPSKSDLAASALEEYWARYRQPELDRVFSIQHPPVERLLNYCDQVYDNQKKRFERWGKVVGCPISAMGSELSTQDEKIRHKSEEIASRICRYFEAALRDAAREGLTKNHHIPERARDFYSFVTGVLLQARIRNDLEFVRVLKPAMRRLLALEESVAA